MSMSNMPLRVGAERRHHPHHSHASSTDLVLSGASNPHNQPVSVSANGRLSSVLSSNLEGATGIVLMEDGQLVPVPLTDPPKSPPPSAPEAPNVDNAPHYPLLAFHSAISAPTPSTPMSSLGDLDTFIHTLNQELYHSSNSSIRCSVKRNDEPENTHDGPLEQRLEKKMNVQLSVIPPAANQRIKLPVPPTTFANAASEPKLLFLSLVIAGEITRSIFGGVGLYHQSQPKSELVILVEGSNFSPIVGITSGRTVCIGFKFTTYPRQCDPSEEAFRVVATIHDCDGKLVAYGLSSFAYSVKSHPRNIKRALQASTNDSEDTVTSRSKRRRANSAHATTSTTSISGNHALPSNSSAAGSSNQQQVGGSAKTGSPPTVEPAIDRSRGAPIPIVDPQLQFPPHEPFGVSSLNPTEGSQPMPTLVEAVPSSCNWRGGIVVSLFVNNLPQDRHIYARFGGSVVTTVRKTPHVLTCRVPSAPGPCAVDITLSKGAGPFDAPYGGSLCKFTYEEDDIARLVRAINAEAQVLTPFGWHAPMATRYRLTSSQSHPGHSIHDQSALGPWSLPGHARLDVVEESGEGEVGTLRPRVESTEPEHSTGVRALELTSRDRSDIGDKYDSATRVESGGSRKRLDTIGLDDSDDQTTTRTISKQKSKLLKPVTPTVPNSPPSETQSNQPASPDYPLQIPSEAARTDQQPLECTPPTHSQPPNMQTKTPPTAGHELPSTSAINSTNVVDSGHEPGLSAMPSSPPPEVPQSSNPSHLYDGLVDALYRHIRLRCNLKDPRGYQRDQKVVVRREKRVVLELHLQLDDGRIGDMRWQGIALPGTGSVKQSNQSAPTRLLHFSIKVHGSTTGMLLTEPCDKCWRREMRALGTPRDLPLYLIDFKSSSPFVLFSREDTLPFVKAEVSFHFICYSNHQKEDFELVANLHDEKRNLVAYSQLSYTFRCVAKTERDGGLLDDRPSIVPLVVGPVGAPPPLVAGPSSVLHTTTNIGGTVNTPSHTPGPEGHHTNIRHPISPPRYPPQLGTVEARPPYVEVGSRPDVQPLEADALLLLEKVAPVEGPTTGGLNIVLVGRNFPSWPTTLYVRFGSAVAATSWINPFTLECILPASPTSGLVGVTLSPSPDHNAQTLGRSLCTFTYREEQESFLLMLRSIYSQGHELSRVALDTLFQKQKPGDSQPRPPRSAKPGLRSF